MRLGWDDQWAAVAAGAAGANGAIGRVVRHDGSQVLVSDGDAGSHRHLGSDLGSIAVGDWVVVDDDRVQSVLPRRSVLRRRGSGTGDEQLVAANLDVVGLVCGLDRPIKPSTVERLTTMAWDSGASPLIVFTKADLGHDRAALDALVAEAAPGVNYLFVTATSGDGVEELRNELRGSTVGFLGSSGAGKSTLVNALAGRQVALTAEVRSGDNKGRHTTTARELHQIAEAICVIDTPGVRELGLWTDLDTVDEAFGDVSELAEECRFNDCSHATEPGCAVQAALQDGSLDQRRFASWEALRREAASAELRRDPAARRRADRQQGRVYREVQRLKQRHRG